MADDTDLSFFLCGFHCFGTAGYTAVCHIDGFYGVVRLKSLQDFFVGELIVIVGFYDLDLVLWETNLSHAGAETVQAGTVPVEFRVAGRGKYFAGWGNAFAHEFGGNPAAFCIVLTNKAESVSAGEIAVKSDDRNVFFCKGSDLLLNRRVVHGTDGCALNAFSQESVQLFDTFLRNISFTFFYQDLYMEIGKLCLGSFDAAHDLPAEVTGPVGQEHAKLDRWESLAEQSFLIGAPGSEIACLLNGGHDSFVNIRTYMGTVVENPVDCSTGGR